MAATVTATTPQGQHVTLDLDAALSPARREQARGDAIEWIKRFRLVRYDGRSMRERFTYRGDALWWFTELYLHKMRRIDTAVSTVLALEAVREAHQPSRITIQADDPAVRLAATAFGQAHGMPIELTGAGRARPGIGWQSFLIGAGARLSRVRAGARPDRHPAVAAFVHTAFWRDADGGDGPRQESYVGAVLDAVAAGGREGDLYCVGVGPRRNFRARRWWDPVTAPGAGSRLVTPVERLAPSAALADSFRLWRARVRLAHELTTGDDVRAASAYRGCDLWPIVQPELDAVARLQWPWSARAMDEAGAALDALEPGAVVTYAEAGGWGRALVLEARRRGIPSVGLQHGFIYRHWLNYLHEPDEMQPAGGDRGCPIPDRTLVFDRYAETHLREAGHFPTGRVVVTGNARLDELAARCRALAPTRRSIREELGVPAAAGLAVLAAKFSEIRAVLPDLIAAVSALPEMRLIIKTHPAETPDAYAAAVSGAANVVVMPAQADLARLLAAADAIVTMNSTVAIDGLVLGVPALVVGLPNNLSPFVDAGAMAGAAGQAGIGEGLRSLLYDEDARRAILTAGAAFARQYALVADGRAAGRAAAEILALAAHPSARRSGTTADGGPQRPPNQ
jgi:hypothetical protein